MNRRSLFARLLALPVIAALAPKKFGSGIVFDEALKTLTVHIGKMRLYETVTITKVRDDHWVILDDNRLERGDIV